jgi:hypothetical protein
MSMPPREHNPQRSPEWQRRAIEKHLTKFILDPQDLPGTEDTFYERPPESDSPLRALYDKAGANPVLYALYYSQYMAAERIAVLNDTLESEGAISEVEAELGLVELESQEIAELIEQYTDPENHPFLTVDLLDERGQPYA